MASGRVTEYIFTLSNPIYISLKCTNDLKNQPLQQHLYAYRFHGRQKLGVDQIYFTILSGLYGQKSVIPICLPVIVNKV